jgi:hypothetical protein
MFSAGTSYRMSYQVTPSNGGVTMHVKVGLSVPPYTADFEADQALGSGQQPYMHTFMPTVNDANAGIAFTFPTSAPSMVCFDNVSIVRN